MVGSASQAITAVLEIGFAFRKSKILSVRLFLGVLVFALAINLNCTSKQAAPFGKDINRLAQLIELPVVPVEVWFGMVARGIPSWVPEPTDWIFVAVMRFEPQALQNFLAAATLDERLPATILRSEVAPWFPKEIESAFTALDEKKYKIKGRKFTATPFAVKPGTQSDQGNVGSFLVIEGLPYVILRRAL